MGGEEVEICGERGRERKKKRERETKGKGEGERRTGVTGQDVWKGPVTV